MMTKRIFSALLAAALSLSLLAGCGSSASGSIASSAADGPQRYSTVFYDVFDTVTQVIAYCDSEEEFTAQMDALHADLVEYNQLYDIYNDYDGVTNITIAPCFLRSSTNFATVEAFCPIATYTHIISLPFWLRMVSRAMEVLPV